MPRLPRPLPVAFGAAHQAVEQTAGGGVRNHAELAFKHGGAVMVGTQRARAIAKVGLEAHQGPVADLIEWLQLNPAAGGCDRGGQVALAGVRPGEEVAQFGALALEIRSDLEQPVVVVAWQELTVVMRDGPGRVPEDRRHVTRRPGGQCCDPLFVEDAQVNAARSAVAPAQVARGHDQRRLIADHLAEVVQLAAQVRQSLAIGRIGPEQSGDPLPRLRRSSMSCQETEQRDRARRPDPHAGGPLIGNCLFPQHANVQHMTQASLTAQVSPARLLVEVGHRCRTTPIRRLIPTSSRWLGGGTTRSRTVTAATTPSLAGTRRGWPTWPSGCRPALRCSTSAAAAAFRSRGLWRT